MKFDLDLSVNPEYRKLCEVDSFMPSPSRNEETNQESLNFSLAPCFKEGDPLNPVSSLHTLQNHNVKEPVSTADSGNLTEKLDSSLPTKGVCSSPLTAKAPLAAIPLQGAWTLPPKLPTPAIPILRYNTTSLISDLDSQWPSLATGNQTRSRRPSQAASQSSTHQPATVSKASLASIDLDHGLQSPEYPWAAKMKPSVRNLHRVTNPSFMEDGTPKVCIPKKVLLEGVENQKEFIIGQFYRCVAPTGGQIHAVMSRIWGKRCRIFTRKLGESSFLFHIPDEATRQWILQRGLWHVDDCLMFVSAWNPVGTITLPEINTIPVWVTLKNIPNQLYSTKGISWIGSGLGAPMLTSKPWLDPTKTTTLGRLH